MSEELNIINILTNKDFLNNILFDKNKIITIFIFSIISTLIYTSFPLITQAYIRYLYYQDNLELLILFTIIFSILYLIKLFLDIKVENYKNKFYLKLEKNIKEKILKKYSKKIEQLLIKRTSLLRKDVRLYLLLTKNVHSNILDIIKIIFIGVTIYFFEQTLFLYFLVSLPFFALFYFLIKKSELKKSQKKFNYFL